MPRGYPRILARAVTTVLLAPGLAWAQVDTDSVGSSSCRECHGRFYDLWAGSAHGRSVRTIDERMFRTEFSPQPNPIHIRKSSWQVYARQGEIIANELNSHSDSAREHDLRFVVGGKSVCFFLTQLEDGRRQVVPVGYDVNAREWYDLGASMVRHHLGKEACDSSWTDRAFDFDETCAACHVSRSGAGTAGSVSSHVRPVLDGGISCEMCHGPCAAHVEDVRAHGESKVDLTLLKRPQAFEAQRSDSLCGSCHALARPLTGTFDTGDLFSDHFELVGLESTEFDPAGYARGETYTYASHLLSPCVQRGGLTCIHCHTPSGRLRQVGENTDALCLPCHEAIVSRPASHSHHAPGSEASRCVNCHMVETTFARFRRHDHSYRAPLPGASIEFGSPNACTQCHQDRDAVWANRWVRTWYPSAVQDAAIKQARLIEAARRSDTRNSPEMMRFVADRSKNEVVRASLIRLMGRHDLLEASSVIASLADDSSNGVRAATADALSGSPHRASTEILARLSNDLSKAVRINAARALSGHPLSGLSEPLRRKVERVFEEFERLAARHSGDPDWQRSLGVFHQNRGDWIAACAAYQRVLAFIPTDLVTLVNLSMLYAEQDQLSESEALLRIAVQSHPDNAAARLNLGLLFGRTARLDLATEQLHRVLQIDPTHHQAEYNLAVIAGQQGRLDEALLRIRKANVLKPDDPRYREALAYYETVHKQAED